MKPPAFSRIIRLLLIFLAIITTLKILSVGYDIDEQYAISMSYRLLKGDVPIRDMWEPHQTSGFLAAILMIPYLAFTGGTSGIVLYLRFCGLIIHSLIAFLFYGQLKAILTKYTSVPQGMCQYLCLLIVCIYFFSLPKLMFLPEFSNMQLWFLMLMLLCMSYYYTQNSSPRKASLFWLVGAGLSLSLEVLSYPSSLLLFPVCIYYILHYHSMQAHLEGSASSAKYSTVKELTSFCLPCVMGALLFIGYLLVKMSSKELVTLLPFATSDGSHAISLSQKLLTNGISLLEIIGFFAAYGIIAFALSMLLQNKGFLSRHLNKISSDKKTSLRLLWCILLLFTTLSGQVLIWLFGNRYPNYPLVEYFFVPILALTLISPKTTSEKMFFSFFVFLPLTAFAGIVLFTNHPLLVSAPFLGICAAGTLLYTLLHLNNYFSLFRMVITVWVVVLLFGKCYMVRTTGGVHYTLFEPVSIMREGPAAGIIADTETVRKYKAFYALLEEFLPKQSKVFYVGSSNGLYLMQDMEFCTPSTISSPTFDEKLETYFSLHPEKIPEYIICDVDLAAVEGDSFLSHFLRKYCIPEPIAEDDFLVIYQVLSTP